MRNIHPTACILPLKTSDTEIPFTLQEKFNDQDSENCTCPVPCDKRMFDPIVTYASNSNFDMDIILRGDTKDLHSKYVTGGEISFHSMVCLSVNSLYHCCPCFFHNVIFKLFAGYASLKGVVAYKR